MPCLVCLLARQRCGLACLVCSCAALSVCRARAVLSACWPCPLVAAPAGLPCGCACRCLRGCAACFASVCACLLALPCVYALRITKAPCAVYTRRSYKFRKAYGCYMWGCFFYPVSPCYNITTLKSPKESEVLKSYNTPILRVFYALIIPCVYVICFIFLLKNSRKK